MSAIPQSIAYKESEIPWVGKIPEHWEIRRVKHLFEIGRGRVISQEELDDNGLYPVYSSQTQDNGVLGYIQTYDFDCEQITWTTDGVNAGTVFLRRGKHNCTNVCGTLRPKNKNENIVFLTFALQNATPYYKRPDTNGAKIMNNEMAEILLIYPPLKEQQAIANFLDKKTRQIEEFIDKKQKLITLLEEKKQTLINQCVTQGLDPSTPLKDSGVEWLGKIPTHWRMIRLGIAYPNAGSGTTPKSDAKEYYDNGNIVWINSGDLNNSVLSDSEKKITNKALEDYPTLKVYPRDSIVVAMYGATIGKVSILGVEACVNQACCVLPKSDFFEYSYVFYWFIGNKKNIIEMGVGGGQPNISQEIIRNLKISLPPLEEQKAIAEYLDTQIEKIDLAICKIKSQINLIKEYKTTLISEAVCGRVGINLEKAVK